ncbi:unnamed protein product [Lactuca saligna]|uniref:TIR domain-containing protein n=1 Tax=Lactuca saligna TaxID=75948 RepID=A0AA35VY46_LACSI|nr:unnamed protein product [Lactuca saligna]
MASSSIYKNFKYDVFLSFCGDDVRKTFVDHLYHALKQKNIHTYKDDEEINQGNWISDELMGSIEDSKLYIIVFSTNYASSSWCLDELVKIMNCHKTKDHTAYPVFYDVEPKEVRRQSGVVGEAFSKHENKNEETTEKWRKAMTDAANLAGWVLKNTDDGHEAKFIQKIVEGLSLELQSLHFGIDEKLVGMVTRMNDVLSALGTGCDDVRMIGIKGMGGGGKTSLARAVFDQISFQFEGASFVENVREISKDYLSGLKSLQKQILCDVLNEQGITVSSVYDGNNKMKRRICGKKVLLVLDDVDHVEQLEALAGETNWFKQGSRIIITTRDEQVLVAHGVKSIHNIKLLLDKEAICLFCRYAFGRVIPNLGYEELSQQVVHYAAGLPLTIKVLGSFLCGKSELEWIDALERLKTIPLKETLKKLELSYMDLEDDYKEIFLDVACILKGSPKDTAIRMLESCGFHARNGLRVLEQKSLITNHNGYLSMHDHIEEMGKNIIRRSHPDKPHKHSRLWIDNEIEHILANDLGTKSTRYIRFHMSKLSPEIMMKSLRKMKELRFLHVLWGFIDASTESDCSCPNFKFPNTLQYLHWHAYPFRSLPETFQANNLVALLMSNSKIVQLWEGGETKVLHKLRFLDLSYSKLRTLDLGLTPNIETVRLEGCADLVEVHFLAECLKLITVHLGFSMVRTLHLGSTPNLELLDLQGCPNLVELQMPRRSPNLRYLRLTDSMIKNLDIGLTPNLEELDLQNCNYLEELHMVGGCLEKLVYFDMSDCLRFNHFQFCIEDETLEVAPLAELKLIAEPLDGCSLHPNNNFPKFRFRCLYKENRPLLTTNIVKLISIGPCDCTNLDTLSRSICGLQLLRKLILEGGIQEVPKDLDKLEYLEKLEFSYTNIKHLPDNICMLKHLKYLHLRDCSLLEKLPKDLGELECLKELTLSSAKIKDLPDSICMLKHLESLKLVDCSLLEKLPKNLGQLECLKELTLSSAKIKDLPDSICKLKHLESLKLVDCWLLEKLPKDLGELECLNELTLSSAKINDLPDSICMLKHLESFKLKHCSTLEKLPKDLGELDCLKHLNLYSAKIKDLPDSICMLKHLVSLGLEKCLFLEKLPKDLGRLECLEKLDLRYCKLLQRIPDSICNMKRLKRLHLRYCVQLEKLPDELGRLESLRYLDLRSTCICHLPQSIFLLEVCITGEGAPLELYGPYCYIHVSNDDFERLGRPGKSQV